MSEHLTDADVRAVEQFLYREAALLDARDYPGWLGLLTEDCRYWIPAGRDDSDPVKETSLLYDDRAALGARVARLFHPAAHSQTPPSRTVHVLGNVRLEAVQPTSVGVLSNFVLFESRLGVQRVFGGHFEHQLRRSGEDWRIALKKVCLVNNDGIFGTLTFLF